MILDIVPLVGFLLLALILFSRIITLHKQGIQLSSKAANNNKVSKLLLPVFVLIFLLWLFEIVRPAFQISLHFLPEPLSNWLSECIILKITGSIFILISLIMWVITLTHFNTSLRFGLDKNTRGKLITIGIFSISRNPFFLSLDIYFIGTAMVLPSIFFLVFAATTVVSIHFFILKEERFMADNYSEEYLKYRQKTRRYF
ncbi:methyltransferase family protein [Maribellus mangrovi]|uniref:methyltransferase family protein n=1 Tax=Maribellus mangrovi TaxID=3133146 RepID=UPI0030EB8520